MDAQNKLRHLRIDGWAKSKDYTSKQEGRDNFKMPPRVDRKAHGEAILQQLAEIDEEIRERVAEQATRGVVLSFQGRPGFELRLKSLESMRAGVELLASKEEFGLMSATVFVPQGKLSYFTNLVKQYLDPEKDTEKGNPKNQKLVTNISGVKLAALGHLWTDPLPFPDLDTGIAWEVWLRAGDGSFSSVDLFRSEAAEAGMEVGARQITFPDRVVLMAKGTARQLSSSLLILDVLAELRLAKECPTFFLDMAAKEQLSWVESLLSLVTAPSGEAVAICILDRGVHQGHPLLRIALDAKDVLTCFPPGPPADQNQHGTEIGGLALYGNLMTALQTSAPIPLEHRLESVKILPTTGANHQDVYGSITLEAVGRIAIAASERKRIFCMAVTATDTRDMGEPSSWSAAVDDIAFGKGDAPRALFLISAGNAPVDDRFDYPKQNHEKEGVHDPGQSWNAVTVGACTHLAFPTAPEFADYQPLAPLGGLSAWSSTSCMWDNKWPFKPDIVMEGGNHAVSPDKTRIDRPEDLCLLTTRREVDGKLFSLMWATSASTALAARMAAQIQAAYPTYWPETVRALLVHSAEWTETMMNSFANPRTSAACRKRLRCFGYGVPDLDRALWCAGNALTLISQVDLQPYKRVKERIVSNHMHLYALPWPAGKLRELLGQPVRMRITLSYFIQSNPGKRGWKYKHRYASHGLRFAVKKPEESPAEFEARINKLAQSEELGEVDDSDSREWVLGPRLRNRGSLIADWWEGTAAELADCGSIAVYPVIGWWRERKQLNQWGNKARYSLVVSLTTDAANVDLYTPVRNMVEVEIPV